MLQPLHAVRGIEKDQMFSSKSISMGFVAGLHVMVVWGVIHAFVPHVIPTIDHFVFVPSKQTEAKELPPPPQPKEYKPVAETALPPPFDLLPDDPAPTRITTATATALVRPNAIPDRGPVAFNIGAKPPYPAIAARMHREGEVTLRLVVSETGKVTSTQLVKSSGYSELDQAALEWAVSWKFKPAIKDGQPAASTAVETVVFNLEDR